MAESLLKSSRAARYGLPVLSVLAVASLVAAVVLPAPGRRAPDANQADADPELVPPFALTERSGKPVNNADLKGKVWVAAFVFTRCTGPCPSVSATMARLQAELDLATADDLRLVTFTVDPDRDTPDELKKYAEHFRAHPDRWLFLTGKEAEIHRLARDGFHILAERSATPKPGDEFNHSTKLAVVDKKGRVRAYFDGYAGKHDDGGRKYEEGVVALKETVAALRKE